MAKSKGPYKVVKTNESLLTCLSCRKGVVKPHQYTAKGHLFWETKRVDYTVFGVPCMMCDVCAEITLGTESETPIFEHVRSKLGLLTAFAIRNGLEMRGMTQKMLAKDIGCSEEAVSRWVTSDQIQSRMADKAMRMAFRLRASRAKASSGHVAGAAIRKTGKKGGKK